jgi:tetratricopeptide (TPR) repeat protein
MKNNNFTAIVLLITLWSCATKTPDQKIIPLFDNLSEYHRGVTTKSESAQQYFDQGLTLYYGFNHEAAIKSFQQAIAYDSTCAMAWWGQAISEGPNINNPVMDSVAKAEAWQTILKAQQHLSDASPLEQELIKALSLRYAWPAPENRKSLDSTYADAMREIYKENPDDPDVGALFADALLNIRPWDYWKPDGTSQPGTEELVSVLEHTLSVSPDHPGACHFYIHTMEASSTPKKALPAADKLRNRIPGAGHLVHMPSHIDIRLGHYKESIVANQKAIIADSVWVKSGGFYTMYRAHNFHFLAYSAMFTGQKQVALDAGNSMINQIPEELVNAFPDFLEGFMAIPYHVMIRFGMWDEIITLPEPPKEQPLTRAFWRYSRVVAFSATGKVNEASAEFNLLQDDYNNVPDSRMIGNNPGKTVLKIGLHMAEGEMEYRKANYEKAFHLLRLAVQEDDSLRYDEPWGWMMPIRHSLGALLIEQKKFGEAENVYKRDLEIHPGNGWALKGLSTCYHNTGRHMEAMNTDELFDQAWSDSDIPLLSSCFCSKGELGEH